MIKIVRFFVKLIFAVLYRVQLTGTENVPKNGAALLCANHNGELDMFFIGYRIKRLVRWMAKVELFKNPVVSFLLTWLGAFPVKRGLGDVRAIKNAFKLLEEGHIVGMFIEGTRTRGKVSGAKPGAAMIAIKAGIPILPVVVIGKYKPFSRVKIVFGKPFMLNTDKEKKYSNEELKGVSENILQKVYALSEEK